MASIDDLFFVAVQASFEPTSKSFMRPLDPHYDHINTGAFSYSSNRCTVWLVTKIFLLLPDLCRLLQQGPQPS